MAAEVELTEGGEGEVQEGEEEVGAMATSDRLSLGRS